MRINIILTLLSLFLISFHSQAMEMNNNENSTQPSPSIAIKSVLLEVSPSNQKQVTQRKLDLKDYPCFTSRIHVKNKEYGVQHKDHGPFEEIILADIQAFLSTHENLMIWVEIAAGYGAFPLRVFEHIPNQDRALFIVNDLYENNLESLKELIDQPENHQLASVFKIIPGDCLTLHATPLFKQNVPQGADFQSALCLIHFLSPYKIVNFFANTSESLKVGGKFYVDHDLERALLGFTYGEDVFKKCTEHEYNTIGKESYEKLFEENLSKPLMANANKAIRERFIVECLQKEKINFPYYLSANLLTALLRSPVDEFTPSPEFIKEVAQVVGFTLKMKIPMKFIRRNNEAELLNATEEEASCMGYVFVKEKNEDDFRETPAFKDLINKTKFADEQRENIKFKSTCFYPFIERVK